MDIGIGPRTKTDGEKAEVVNLPPGPRSPHSLQRRHRAIIADGYPLESNTFFRVHWNCGRVILQSPSGRFLSIATNGLLMANATIPGEPSHCSPPTLTHARDSARARALTCGWGERGDAYGGQKPRESILFVSLSCCGFQRLNAGCWASVTSAFTN